MKQINLSYRSGEQETFITTDANAATMVERFCHGRKIWVEKYAFRKGEFKRLDARFVLSESVARVVVDRDDFTGSIPVG